MLFRSAGKGRALALHAAAFLFYKAAVWAAGKGLVSGNKLNSSRDEKEFDDYESKCDTYNWCGLKEKVGIHI